MLYVSVMAFIPLQRAVDVPSLRLSSLSSAVRFLRVYSFERFALSNGNGKDAQRRLVNSEAKWSHGGLENHALRYVVGLVDWQFSISVAKRDSLKLYWIVVLVSIAVSAQNHHREASAALGAILYPPKNNESTLRSGLIHRLSASVDQSPTCNKTSEANIARIEDSILHW